MRLQRAMLLYVVAGLSMLPFVGQSQIPERIIKRGIYGGQEIEYVARELLVKTRAGITDEVFRQVMRECAIDVAQDLPLGWKRVVLAAEDSLFTVVGQLRLHPAIAWAEPNGVMYLQEVFPNDPSFSLQ